ncbi:MAG: sugar phosphate isomerase/epimerase [Anaerolineae bacterium]|nr:sugar phosphate isomerase/epimerase [Anaerolineae bacterium]
MPIDIHQLVDNGVEETLRPLQTQGLSVCQIGAFGFNPLLPGEAEAAMLRRAIEMAPDTGCPYIVINGGNYHASGFLHGDVRNFTDHALQTIASYLSPFVEKAEKHSVKLSIEPYLKGAINTPERFLALKKLISSDALCVNVDVTSFYDYRAMWDPAPVVENTCKMLAGHYGLGHIKDLVLREGFHIHIDLAPLGSSRTDWSQVLSLMAPHMPEDSWLILEHVSSPDEAARSLQALRDAATQAGVELV